MLNAFPPQSGIHRRPTEDTDSATVERLLAENRRLRGENARLRVHVSHSLIDPITGVCGRRYFDRRLQQEMCRADRFDLPLSIVVIDIADLRTITERGGEEQGERVVRWVADLISRSCRECDVPCRISETEFALILPQAELAGAHQVVDRLLSKLRRNSDAPKLPDGMNIGLTFGLASYPEQAETFLELVFEAQESMIEAKTEGPQSERCVVAA